jgi:putative pyruvate formate lyase activating enzyme
MTPVFIPSYLKLFDRGELADRSQKALEHLSSCDVCPWECKVNRQEGKMGVCKIGEFAKVSSYGAHMGEEQPLKGWRGSGTIFFTRCNLRCQYCQNHDISQTDSGQEVSSRRLAEIMLELQALGCHNINLVTPSHVVPQILEAVLVAAQAGLHIPLVYNTGGYDSLEMLRLLENVVDIYMPDMKYANPQIALRYSKIHDYPQVNRVVVREMHHQVGDLQLDEHGIAQRGLLVRHLVLPNDLAGSQSILHFLAEEISTYIYLNLMDQYRPAYQAGLYPQLNRPIIPSEYQRAVSLASHFGLNRLDRRNAF